MSILGSLIIVFYKYDSTTNTLNITEAQNVLIWILYLYRNGMFIGIAFLFVKIFFFFFRIKKAKIAKEGKQFTT